MAPGASGASSGSSSREKTRSAAARVDCSSPKRLANSLMGPENLREYRTKEETPPREICPAIYSIAPRVLTSARERLLMKLTAGPVMQAKLSAR